MSENAQLTAEIERVLDERKAAATATLKVAVVYAGLFYAGYRSTRYVMQRVINRNTRRSILESV